MDSFQELLESNPSLDSDICEQGKYLRTNKGLKAIAFDIAMQMATYFEICHFLFPRIYYEVFKVHFSL